MRRFAVFAVMAAALILSGLTANAQANNGIFLPLLQAPDPSPEPSPSVTPTDQPVPTVITVPDPTATATSQAPGKVEIIDIFYNGQKGWPEPDEYVEIRNTGGTAVNLDNWTLRDEANHVFTFPNFMMQPNQICRVYTNENHPEYCGFSYGNEGAIWNNPGDCAYLRDAGGTLVDQFCY